MHNRVATLLLTTTLVALNTACMAMKEGTYEVPGTPAPAAAAPLPVPVRDPGISIAALPSFQPIVIPAPAFAEASLPAPPIIEPGCDTVTDAKSVVARRVTSTGGRLSAPQNVTSPRPFVLLPRLEDWKLREKVRDRLGDDADEYGVVIKDLQTGKGTVLNGDKVFFTASLFKIYVMFEVMHQESLGLLKLTDEVTITPYYDQQSVGPRLTSLCQRLTIKQALEAMMARSDNSVAVLLQDLVGSPNINQTQVSLGLRSSNFLSEDLPTSAGDIASMLEGIGRYQAVTKSSSEEMVRLLSLEQFDNGLRAGTPQTVRIAHKTGNYQGVTHDAGIVYGPSGAYLVVVLSYAANPTGVIKDMASIAYDHFASQSGPMVAVATPRAR